MHSLVHYMECIPVVLWSYLSELWSVRNENESKFAHSNQLSSRNDTSFQAAHLSLNRWPEIVDRCWGELWSWNRHVATRRGHLFSHCDPYRPIQCQHLLRRTGHGWILYPLSENISSGFGHYKFNKILPQQFLCFVSWHWEKPTTIVMRVPKLQCPLYKWSMSLRSPHQSHCLAHREYNIVDENWSKINSHFDVKAVQLWSRWSLVYFASSVLVQQWLPCRLCLCALPEVVSHFLLVKSVCFGLRKTFEDCVWI